MARTQRSIYSEALTIQAGSSLSTTPIDMRRVVDGIVEMPAAWTAANIGFKVSSGSSVADALPLYNASAAIVQISSPSVSKAFRFPTELFPAHYVWLWSQNGSGVSVDQASASRSILVQLKS